MLKKACVLVSVSLAVIKYLDQKQLEGRIRFILQLLAHTLLLKSVKEGIWRQELKQKLQMNTSYCQILMACQPALLGGTSHSELSPPTPIINQENTRLQACRQSVRGIVSAEVPLNRKLSSLVNNNNNSNNNPTRTACKNKMEPYFDEDWV